MFDKLIVSHRGNIEGPDPRENDPRLLDLVHSQLRDILIEVDAWGVDSELYLGHDGPIYKYDLGKDLNRHKKIYHLKNLEAYTILSKDWVETFGHSNDPYVITSKGRLWCFPGVYYKDGITVEIGRAKDIPDVAGICTDYVLDWIDYFKNKK